MPTDTPADERCETCDRLDPINCPCPAPLDPDTWTEDVSIDLATTQTAPALRDVADERVRQVAKWGVQTRPDGTGAPVYVVLAQEAKERTDEAAADGSLTWRHILDEEVLEAYAETDATRLREELVQVAAVALSWVEDIDRKASA